MTFKTIETNSLHSKNEIKLLICYILSSVKSGLSKNDIVSLLQDNGFSNYFDSVDAFSDLLNNHNIVCIDEETSIFTVTDSGKMISNQLDVSLPITIREKALSAAINVLNKCKLERENSVDITKTEQGYLVSCHISGGDVNLLSFTLYVPDEMQANMVKKNFHKNPELIYQTLLSLVTENKDFAINTLNNIGK